MASNESNVAVKHLSGKLSKHFIFKLTADGKVDDGDKVYVPCERLFSSSGYIVNKMRSCLLPENVNALVCLRDWLK